MLVNVYVDNHFVRFGKVFMQRYDHIGIAEAFFLEILLYYKGSTVDNVLSNLVAHIKLQFFLQIIFFAFLYSIVVDSGNLRLLTQID